MEKPFKSTIPPGASRRHRKGKLFVISSPSGGGKTTLCNRLLKDGLGLIDSVSVTTRPPRPGERNGRDYHFVSKRRFMDMVKNKELLEYENNFGYFYGTPKGPIEDSLKKGRSVLLSVDVKGAMKIRRAYPRRSVLVFIVPPSIGVLENRLKSRMSDDPGTISARVKIAKKELGFKGRYDYRIVNNRLDSAHNKLKTIVESELKYSPSQNE